MLFLSLNLVLLLYLLILSPLPLFSVCLSLSLPLSLSFYWMVRSYSKKCLGDHRSTWWCSGSLELQPAVLVGHVAAGTILGSYAGKTCAPDSMLPPPAPLFFGGRNTTSNVQGLLTAWCLGLFLAMLYEHALLGIQMRSPACKVFAQFLSRFLGTHLILDHHVHCQCLFLFLLFSLVILMTKSHTYLLFTHLTVMLDRVLLGWCAYISGLTHLAM